MKESGTVIKAEKTSAVIEIRKHEECHKCGGCNTARPVRMTVDGTQAEGLNIGDRVEVEIAASTMMKAYLLLYALPLVVFVAVILILYAVLRSPILSFMGAVAGTILAYLTIGLCIRKKHTFSPNIHPIR